MSEASVVVNLNPQTKELAHRGVMGGFDEAIVHHPRGR